MLPKGNYALSIAHPGHELRLHGFIEQAKPFTFLLADGSGKDIPSLFTNAQDCIYNAMMNDLNLSPKELASEKWMRILYLSQKVEDSPNQYIKEEEIINEILEQRTGFFIFYINFLATNFIKWNIDYIVSDPREGYNVLHDICSIVTNLAVKLVKKVKDKKIIQYQYALNNKYENIGDDCIHIVLDDLAIERKIKSIVNYHPSVYNELSSYLGEELTEQIKLCSNNKTLVKELLNTADKEIFRNEHLCPFNTEHGEIPYYELNGEKLVATGIYPKVISYKKHIIPLKEQLTAKIKNLQSRI